MSSTPEGTYYQAMSIAYLNSKSRKEAFEVQENKRVSESKSKPDQT